MSGEGRSRVVRDTLRADRCNRQGCTSCDGRRDSVESSDKEGVAVVSAPPCAEECRRILLDIFTAKGADVHVTWAPPLFPTGYEPLNMDCPHGVLWFAEPTAEQRAKYAAESTP